MKKVYSADTLIMAGHVKCLLENNNIECIIKNQNLSGGVGELPPIECWPEVWVLEDRDYKSAASIVDSVIYENNISNISWQCSCGEVIEGQFGACWNCGKEKPD